LLESKEDVHDEQWFPELGFSQRLGQAAPSAVLLTFGPLLLRLQQILELGPDVRSGASSKRDQGSFGLRLLLVAEQPGGTLGNQTGSDQSQNRRDDASTGCIPPRESRTCITKIQILLFILKRLVEKVDDFGKK